ncbi:MAG TPA: EAL domain-containing protein [Croceibacterium sp.]
MLRVYACIVQEHDLRLVVVAVIICLLASCIAFSAFKQAQRDKTREPLWTALTAIVAGLGIWATHFVAMLAFEPNLPVGYDIGTTLMSVVVAVVVSGMGWRVALDPRPATVALGGAIVGVGVATMHFIGMGALEIAGLMVWDRSLVMASIGLGVVLSALAVRLSRSSSRVLARSAPLVLALAICALHFVAMAAVRIYPGNAVDLTGGAVDSATLATVVTAGILLIMLAGFGLLSFERTLARVQLDEAAQRSALAEQILQTAAERDALTAQLQREAELSTAALENMVHGLSVYDENERLVVFNQKYAELYGIPAHLLVPGTPFFDIREHLVASGTFPDNDEFYHNILSAKREEGGRFEVSLLDGRIVEVRMKRMPSGGRLATHEDVTAARKSAQEIAWLAAHDALTGLPNRTAFARKLAAALADAPDPHLAMLTIDLDRFKEVNDTLGHPFGDRILRHAAERLSELAGTDDVVTRLGGDEFAVIQLGVSDPVAAGELAARIIDALDRPFEFEGHTVVIGASIGIALAPRDSANPDELMQMSDLALYRAKAESRGTHRFFEPGMDARLRERRSIEAGLRVAIREGQFEVLYQPQLDLRSGAISGFEALVRWNHPTRGVIQPLDFIPVAEDTSLIIPIGEWVLRQACRDAARWPEDVKVAVNLSPAQFKRGDLIAVTMNALAAANLAPGRLELEITESVLLHDETWVRSVLDRLTAFGVGIALDDFGTGYSSLSYLRSFPFSKIKIDRSFVADLAGASDCRAIVQATIQLSEKLGMRTTAEGVETAEQLDILAHEGCTQVQGFRISRPVPALAVPALLDRYAPDYGRVARVV